MKLKSLIAILIVAVIVLLSPLSLRASNADEGNLVDISQATITFADETFVYYPKYPHFPTLTITDNGKVLSRSTDYVVSYRNNVNAGEGTVVVEGKGDYQGKIEIPFTIQKAPISEGSISISLIETTYSGRAYRPTPVVKYHFNTLIEGVDYEVSYSNNTNVGTASVEVKGIGNYKGSLTATFKILALDISRSSDIECEEIPWQYPIKWPCTPGVVLRNLNNDGAVLTPEKDYTLQYFDNTEEGTASVTIWGEGNYKGSRTEYFNITKPIPLKNVTIEKIPNQKYTGKQIKPVLDIHDDYAYLVEGEDYKVEYRNNINEGKAVAVVTGIAYYQGTVEIPFQITRERSLSKALISGVKNKTYDGKNQTQTPTVKVDGAALKKGTDYTISYKNNKNVGTATMTITGKGNYTGAKSITFKINAATPHVNYRVHRQTYGWEKDWKKDGQSSGTTGQSKRLEGIYINLDKGGLSGSIQYRVHVQTYGWAKKPGKPGTGWVNEGKMAGTTGESKRLEAIQIKLTGEMAKQYDIYYRVHAQKFGWMGWAKNGASAGTAGYSYRLEAIQIKLVKKGGKAPGSTANAFRQSSTKSSVARGVSGSSLNKVVVTKSGKKFHRSSCATIKNSKGKTTLTKAEAQKKGYSACKVCNP